VKRNAFLLVVFTLIILASAIGVQAATTTTTSQWQLIEYQGNAVVQGVLSATRTGNSINGTWNKNTIQGTLVNDGRQLNGTWTGPQGSGWITLHYANDGNGFHGTWGQKGKPAAGKLIGQRLTPSPAPAAT
jgi:hypothetical protein